MGATADGGDLRRERRPHGGNFSGFAQGIDYSVDGRTLDQATNVENPVTTYNDVRVGSIPLDAQQYEAELATLNSVSQASHVQASNGSKIGNINDAGDYVPFTVRVPTGATSTLNVRYANGKGANSTHSVSVNGGGGTTITYPATVDWGRYQWQQISVSLNAGANTVRFSRATSFAELDVLHVYRSSTALDPQFRIVNRASGKLLEVLSALTTDGARHRSVGADRQSDAGLDPDPGVGGYLVVNRNSGKLLEIPSASTADGTDAVQWGPTGHATQRWNLATSGGWWTLTNPNSSKLLEITGGSSADGAIAQQWPGNGATAQQWRLVKEGIQ